MNRYGGESAGNNGSVKRTCCLDQVDDARRRHADPAVAVITRSRVRTQPGPGGRGRLGVVVAFRHLEDLLPERPRLGGVPGMVERPRELEGRP
jgi:hypothetical protein